VGKHRQRLGDKADAVSAAWRTKQLEYTWLRSLMDRYVDFWHVTGEALDFALDQNGVDDGALREDLIHAYLALDSYPEVPEVLKTLKDAGMQTAILSNGSPRMLEAAVESSGLTDLLDAVLSVDELGIYKPAPEVYQQVLDRLAVGRGQVSFQSSNAWDAAAAATFGFRVAWCNRFGQAKERLPDAPEAEIRTLSELPAIVLP
jgi:2-haloacid dehalogenase